MFLTEEQRKIASKAIAEKYGLEAIVDLKTYEPEDALKQYQEFIAQEKEAHAATFKTEETDQLIVRTSTRLQSFKTDKVCSDCGKQWKVMSAKDKFVVFNHGCCQECFFKKN